MKDNIKGIINYIFQKYMNYKNVKESLSSSNQKKTEKRKGCHKIRKSKKKSTRIEFR